MRQTTETPPGAGGGAGGTAHPAPCPAPIFRVGQVLNGTYEIRRLLGHGGMAQVYEARDLQLGRRVAIKVDTCRDPQAASWLRREAQALAMIRSRHVVAVYGLARHEELDYLVMDLLRGDTLAHGMAERHRARQPFAIGEVLEILAGIARALADVHQAGLAHRDLKPANIILTPDGNVVLIDFGVVLPEVLAGMEASLVGTPHYMAPEALAGRLTPGCGRRLDLYAFGVIGFELLAGRRPFEARSLADLIVRQRQPAVDVGRLRPDTPRRLAGLISECLALAPEQRPVEIEAVRFDIEAITRALAPRRPEDKAWRHAHPISEDLSATTPMAEDRPFCPTEPLLPSGD
jgi:serine/threonine-protein kinase